MYVAEHATSSTTERKEKQALVQLTLIIASFLLGYIPDLSKCHLSHILAFDELSGQTESVDIQ